MISFSDILGSQSARPLCIIDSQDYKDVSNTSSLSILFSKNRKLREVKRLYRVNTFMLIKALDPCLSRAGHCLSAVLH